MRVALGAEGREAGYVQLLVLAWGLNVAVEQPSAAARVFSGRVAQTVRRRGWERGSSAFVLPKLGSLQISFRIGAVVSYQQTGFVWCTPWRACRCGKLGSIVKDSLSLRGRRAASQVIPFHGVEGR